MFPYDWYDDNTELTSHRPDELAPLPVLKPIEVKPVELNAQLWAEWKRIAEKLP